MGLSKSKPTKPNQPGFQQSQQGFPSQPGFPAQAGYQGPGFATAGFPNQSQSNFSPNQPGLPTQAAFPTQPGLFNGPPMFNVQTGFPPLPTQPGMMQLPPAQQLSGFPGALFPQSQGGNCFPVSYANQVFKPLIPGYAPAPGNDRRSNVLAQQEQEQNEFASRYFVDQQMSQMQGHKQRKH